MFSEWEGIGNYKMELGCDTQVTKSALCVTKKGVTCVLYVWGSGKCLICKSVTEGVCQAIA